MIFTNRDISDGATTLIECVLIEPKRLTVAEADALGFKQFACQIGERVIQQGQLRRVEPVCFQFNAPSYEAAFAYAREHAEKAKAELRKEAQAQKARNALLTPPQPGEVNRFKLNGK